MDRRRVRVVCTVALVIGIHAVALWFLLATSRLIIRRLDSQSLEIVFIVRPPAPVDQSAASNQKPSVRKGSREAASRQIAGGSPMHSPAQEENNAIHPPVDWAAELSLAAKSAMADKAAQTPRDFGFPHLPTAPAKTPQFDWDYAATHRVEQLPEGGILINLNDRCVLILFPFPFMACGIGEKPANGELFKHMGDPAAKSQTP